jgi:adenylate cyclase
LFKEFFIRLEYFSSEEVEEPLSPFLPPASDRKTVFYVDAGIPKEIMRRPEAARLGGEKRDVAVLMSDLRDFTPLSETLSPEKTIRVLNLYFSQMIAIIQRHQGIIVDFFGDGMLAFFDPLDGPVAPTVRRALDWALEMQQAMRTLNERIRGNGLPSLQMGIGVNSGEVVVGNIGSESRAKYGIVGGSVNLTQRIQAMAKGGEVLLSHSAYAHVAEDVVLTKSFEVRPKGVSETIKLYVIGSSGRHSAEKCARLHVRFPLD